MYQILEILADSSSLGMMQHDKILDCYVQCSSCLQMQTHSTYGIIFKRGSAITSFSHDITLLERATLSMAAYNWEPTFTSTCRGDRECVCVCPERKYQCNCYTQHDTSHTPSGQDAFGSHRSRCTFL